MGESLSEWLTHLAHALHLLHPDKDGHRIVLALAQHVEAIGLLTLADLEAWVNVEQKGRPDPQPPPADAEQLAQRFHDTYERLAPAFGYETRRESAVPWANVPATNRALMIATVREVFWSAAPAPDQAGGLTLSHEECVGLHARLIAFPCPNSHDAIEWQREDTAAPGRRTVWCRSCDRSMLVVDYTAQYFDQTHDFPHAADCAYVATRGAWDTVQALLNRLRAVRVHP